MKLGEQLLGLLLALSLQRLGHHAGSSFGDRAPRAFETYFLHRIVFQIEINSQLIAAEWIKPLSRVVGCLELAKVSRLLVMVEDDLLVEFA